MEERLFVPWKSRPARGKSHKLCRWLLASDHSSGKGRVRWGKGGGRCIVAAEGSLGFNFALFHEHSLPSDADLDRFLPPLCSSRLCSKIRVGSSSARS